MKVQHYSMAKLLAGIDDVLLEQIKNHGPTQHKWLFEIYQHMFHREQDPEDAMLKPKGLCDTREQRTNENSGVASIVEGHLTKEQAGIKLYRSQAF